VAGDVRQHAGPKQGGNGRLAAVHLQFLAGIMDMKIYGAFSQPQYDAHFPACFTNGGPAKTG